jgi:hypothetical protein
MQLAKDFGAYKADGNKSNKTPTNISEATAVCMSYEACADTTRKAVTDKNVVVEDPIGLVNEQVKFGLLTPAATERLLKSGLPTITAFINTRVPEADRPNVLNLINMSVESKVYGALGNGDIAKAAFTEALAKYDKYKDIGVTLTFKDVTGASALSVMPTKPTPNTPPNKLSVLQDWQRVGSSRPPPAMGTLEKQLKVVDDALRIQAGLTNVSIFELRKKFIQTFTSQGSISEAYTSQTQSMTTGEPAPAVQTPPAAPVSAPPAATPIAPTTSTDFTGAASIPAALDTRGKQNNEAMRREVEAKEAAKEKLLQSGRMVEGKLDDTMRNDGVTRKGNGYLGVLRTSDGKDVTEITTSSSDVKVNGKEIDFPTLVPTLSKEEVDLLLNDILPNDKPLPTPILKKAIDHARKRIKEGKNVFAETGDYKPTKPATSNVINADDIINQLESLK